MPVDFRAAALAYAADNIPVFPCRPDGKEPLTAHGFEDATTDLGQIHAWADQWPNANIAIEPEKAGWCVLDLDGPEAELSLKGIWNDLGIAEPNTYQIRTPRGFRHLYFKGSLPPSASRLAPHLDTRGRKSYVLVPPSVVNGNPYVRINDAGVAPLPSGIGARLAPKEAPVSGNIQQFDTGSNVFRALSEIHRLVNGRDVAIEGSGGDDKTIKVANRILDIVGTPALAWTLLDEHWNPHCEPPWESEELLYKIENAHKSRKNGDGCFAVEPGATAFAHVEKPVPPTYVEVDTEQRKGRFWPRSEAEAADLAPPVWNLATVLMAGTSALVWAATSSLKSFLIFDMAAHVSLGWDWCGQKTRKGLVFYAVGAGEGRIEIETKRRAAWKEAHDGAALPGLYVMNAPRLAMEGEVEAFIAAIKHRAARQHVGMIVIDTVAKSMVGLNENSAQDVSRLAAMTAAILETFPEATVICVHHALKDGENFRGSTALVADFDSVMRVKRLEPKGMLIELHVEQHRDAAEPEPYTFEARLQPMAGSLALFPIASVDHAALAAKRAAASPFSHQKVGAALIEAKAYGRERGISTRVLAKLMAKTRPDMEYAEIEMAALDIAKTLGGLGNKNGPLAMLNERTADGMKWWLPKED